MRPSVPLQPGCEMVFLSCRMNLGASNPDPYEIAQHQRKFSIYNQDNIQTARRNKKSLKSQKNYNQFSQSYAIRVNSQIVSSRESQIRDGISSTSSSAILPRGTHRLQNNTQRTQKVMKRSLRNSNRKIPTNERQTHQRSNNRHDKQNQYLKETRQMTQMLTITDKNILTDDITLNYKSTSNENCNMSSINSHQNVHQRRVMTQEDKQNNKTNFERQNMIHLSKTENVYQSQLMNEAVQQHHMGVHRTMNFPPKPTASSVTLHDKPFFPFSTLSTLPINPAIKKQSLFQGKISGKTSATDLHQKFLALSPRIEVDQPVMKNNFIKKQCQIVSPVNFPVPSSPLPSGKVIQQINRKDSNKSNLHSSQQPLSHSSHPSDPSNTHLRKLSSPRHYQKFYTLADVSACKQVDSSGGDMTSSNHVSIVGSNNSINQSNPHSNVDQLAKCIKLMTLKTVPLNENLWSSWHQNKFQKERPQ